jgi:excinuclease UvrABC nuclease subunit
MENKQKAHLLEQAMRQGWKPEKSYEAYVEEYKQITQIIRNCFEGKTKAVLTVLEEEMKNAISKEHFERCAKLRDIHQFVASLDATYQHIVLTTTASGYV